MKGELSIASLNSNQDSYTLKSFITACTLFIINISYKIQALIDISAHDYAFIDSIAAYSLCELFSILSILLIKSKLIQGFNEKHNTSIMHQILIGLQVIDHFKLFCSLLIITLSQHNIILKKIWINCHRILLNMSVNELYFLLRRCDHLRVSTVISTVKDVSKVNLFSGYQRIATPSKTSVSSIKVSSVKVSSVKISSVKHSSDKPSLSYLPPS